MAATTPVTTLRRQGHKDGRQGSRRRSVQPCGEERRHTCYKDSVAAIRRLPTVLMHTSACVVGDTPDDAVDSVAASPSEDEPTICWMRGRVLRFTPNGGQGLTQFTQPLAVTSRSRRD